MTKRYKLLKDFLGNKGNIPAGEILEKQSGTELGYYSFSGDYKHTGIYATAVENNPDWFQEIKEPEKIEVREFWYECKSIMEGSEYCFEINGVIPKEKIPTIKQAIENVLNEERWETIEDLNKRYGIPQLSTSMTMYTQEQLNEEIEKAGRWTDDNMLEFASRVLKQRCSWAILHDFSAAPVPMQLELKSYKNDKP